jgi:hypothetical protein
MAVVTVWILRATPKAVDFLSYWAAGRLALSGDAASAYDLGIHHAMEGTVVPFGGLLPFAYPPPFLIVVAPFGLQPFWVAFALWIVITAAIYALIVGRNKGRMACAMAHPAVLVNFMIGQNGLLTTGILSGGLQLLPRRPLAGGAVLGLLVIKPQLAIALPFAMVAGRQWRAVAGGALYALLALLIALLLFGSSTYRGFISLLPLFTGNVADGKWAWNELASVFALARYFGLPQIPALAVQAAAAVVAIALVIRAWWLELGERAPILAAAALLASPYLFTYDALLLAIPMLWLIERRRQLAVVGIAWLLCLLPIATFFDFYDGPNTVPVAAVLCMWALHRPTPQWEPLAESTQ